MNPINIVRELERNSERAEETENGDLMEDGEEKTVQERQRERETDVNSHITLTLFLLFTLWARCT